MIRSKVVKIAKIFGFKSWGKLRKYRGSSYQCFRRRNHYAWIGIRYVEIDVEPEAFDFVEGTDKEVRKFFDFACQYIEYD